MLEYNEGGAEGHIGPFVAGYYTGKLKCHWDIHQVPKSYLQNPQSMLNVSGTELRLRPGFVLGSIIIAIPFLGIVIGGQTSQRGTRRWYT
jgi:hypothetical protein